MYIHLLYYNKLDMRIFYHNQLWRQIYLKQTSLYYWDFFKHTLNMFQTRRIKISIYPTTIWRKNYSQPDTQVSSISIPQKLANLTRCWIVIRSMSGSCEISLTAVLRENKNYLLWISKIHYTIFPNDNYS